MHDGIKHTLVAPYHPQSNGLANSQESVKRQDFDARKWSLPQRLANVFFRYRVKPHSTTGTTPAELFLKRQLRTLLSCFKPNLRENTKEQHDGSNFKMTEF